MQDQNKADISGWLSRFQGIERTEEQLVHTAQTADGFCNAAAAASEGAVFEREPSQFFTLLHDLAPDELKK